MHARADDLWIGISRPRGQLPSSDLNAEEEFGAESDVFAGSFFEDPERRQLAEDAVREAIALYSSKLERTKHVHGRLSDAYPTDHFDEYYGDATCFKHRYFAFHDGIEITFGPHEMTITRRPKARRDAAELLIDVDSADIEVLLRNGFTEEQELEIIGDIRSVFSSISNASDLQPYLDAIRQAIIERYGPPDRNWDVQIADWSDGKFGRCASRVTVGRYVLQVLVDSTVWIGIWRPIGELPNWQLRTEELEPTVDVFAGDFFREETRQVRVKTAVREAMSNFQTKTQRTRHVHDELKASFGGNVQVFYGDVDCFKNRYFSFKDGIELVYGMHEFTITYEA